MKRFFKAISVFLLLSSAPLFAQNLIVNGGFEPTGGAYYSSEYTRIYGSNVVEGGCYAIDNSTANHGGGGGWPELTGSSGRFMLVNGFGGNTNLSKVVWSNQHPDYPYIEVTPNTFYTFSCRVVNLNRVIYGQIQPAILQLKINGQNVGSVNQLPSNNDWHTWEVTWDSGTDTQAVIQIFDMYTGNTDVGDDYALDDMSFVANASAPFFTGQTPEIPAICAGNDLTLTAPAFSANGSSITSQGWVASSTADGQYTAFNLNNIPASYNGWYIRYKVESSSGTIFSSPAQQLTVNVAPSNMGTLQTPAAVCVGDDLVVAAPTFDGTGTGSWEICQTQTGDFQPFNLQGVTNNYNGWYLRYKAGNECGEIHSNVVQITVLVAPDFTTATPQIPSICAGGSLSLTPPSFSDVGSTIINQGWVASPTYSGDYSPINLNNIPASYNGWYIRYMVENGCGPAYSNPAQQLIVNGAPEIIGAVQAPAAICAGGSFVLTTPTIQNNGAAITDQGWQIQVNGSWQTLNNSNIPYEYNGCQIRYFVESECGTVYSTMVPVTVYSIDPIDEGNITACDAIYHHGQLCDHNDDYSFDSITPNNCTIEVSWHFTLGEAYIAPVQYQESCDSYYWPKTHQTYYVSDVYEAFVDSDNPQVCDSTYTLDLTINQAPTILSDLQAPANVCVGSGLNVVAPQFQMNHSAGGSQRWEYATSANGPFTAFDPMTGNLGMGTYYIRFVVENSCDEASSNMVSFRVDAAPVANVQLSAMQVCEGQPLDLPEVNVTWNNEDENDRLAQWQMSSTQDGPYAAISPTMPMQMSYNGNWLRFVAHTSCGDDIIGPVMINVIEETEEWLETITECDAYTLPTGETITESQVVDYVYEEPCYHVVHQPVAINHSDEVNELITSCHESFFWNGMTFHHSDQTQYSTVTLTNASGCDSIVNLQLDFGEYAMYTQDRVACESYVWDMNPGHVYTESVRDSVFVEATGQDDCDTWYFLNLTLGHESHIDGGNMNECSGFVWHGVPYYNDAVLYDSLQTVVTHCDSIITYHLHIIEGMTTDTNVVACSPFWWQEHYCETEGDYQHTFQSVYGCDSTVVMHVTMGESVITTLDIQACDSYEFDGVIYDEPGVVYIEIDDLESQTGCDSIVRIRLEIKDSETVGTISGSHSVFVASNLIEGVYRYGIDPTGVVGDVVWALSNPDWEIVESANDHCLIHVTTPGASTLTANFTVADCGEIVRSFEINAGYFGVEEQEGHEVQVYPNPTKGTLHIEAEGIESVRLLDMMGQVLEMRDCGHSDSVTLDLNGYARSVYLLEIKTDKWTTKKRVILCR